MPFPTHKDLPNISRVDAERALSALRLLAQADLASVYTAAGSGGKRWNVWLELTRRRVELPTWAAEWIAEQNTPTGGDAA